MRCQSHSKSVVALFAAAAGAAAAYALWKSKHRTAPDRRVVLITGASSGLGLALAERYGRAGDYLILAARNEDDLLDARNTLVSKGAITSKEDILLVTADVDDPNQAAGLVHNGLSHFGRIDVLINNAGVIEVGPVENQPLSAYQKAMQTNFFGTLHVTQAILPAMLQRKSGNIVNIASIGGKFAMPHLLPYVASKFALVGFSQGLHAELRHKGICVTTVCPGLMRTGSHVRANFVGNKTKEERWFSLSATTPIVAASVQRAAERIYEAELKGRAEITITPQAWLAARFAGVAPETTQFLASLVNEFILPSPVQGELALGAK